MKKIIKKVSILVFTCIFTLFSALSVRAAVLGTLSYWYSNDSSIAKWYATSIMVKTIKLNYDSAFPFDTAVSHATSQWSSPLGITITPSSTSVYGDIEYYGGTRSEIATYTGVTIDSYVTGLTNYYYRNYYGTWTYGSTSKDGYSHIFIYCYLVSDNRTTAAYKNTATHELGHALGWYGHSTNSNDIMYASATTITSLTSRDKNHLSQIY